MKTLEEIQAEIIAAIPAAGATGALEMVSNPSPSGQHSLRVAPEVALLVATYLRDAPELRFDYLSNATGVDWPDKEIAEKVKVPKMVIKTVDGVETQTEEMVEETRKRVEPGYLEAVYHLYSVEKKHGPVIFRLKTANRADQVQLPSMTPIWRGAELQEREIFDLYGIVFTGHPDLRRILMWDAYEDHPMRRDYVEPDDFEYEPTAHDEVLKRTLAHEVLTQSATLQPEPSAVEGGAQ